MIFNSEERAKLGKALMEMKHKSPQAFERLSEIIDSRLQAVTAKLIHQVFESAKFRYFQGVAQVLTEIKDKL